MRACSVIGPSSLVIYRGSGRKLPFHLAALRLLINAAFGQFGQFLVGLFLFIQRLAQQILHVLPAQHVRPRGGGKRCHTPQFRSAPLFARP